jgi:S-adenosylmethionine:tRNA ribosyltransferase-isomerase
LLLLFDDLIFFCRIWQEDEKSDGNGMECFVCIDSCWTISRFLREAGSVPIPPYFHRAAVASDAEAYNTVYAQHGGSVAAPTAGLHFTNTVLSQIGSDNICYLSLHVGAGTFQPVRQVQDARRHAMHAETFAVPVTEIRRLIQALQQQDKKEIVAVGTTSTRTLESLYWCGIQCIAAAAKTKKKKKTASTATTAATATAAVTTNGEAAATSKQDLVLGQFEWIPLNVVAATSGEKDKITNEPTRITRVAALQAVLEHCHDDDTDTADTAVVRGRTSLMITPESYEFQMVDRLITNFHAPDSTLMLLVSAFIQSNGRNQKIRQIYEQAQEHGFRFLSYGDSCLFSKPQPS